MPPCCWAWLPIESHPTDNNLGLRDVGSRSCVIVLQIPTLPQVQTDPEIVSFVSESTRRYMRTMGFNLDSDVATDTCLFFSRAGEAARLRKKAIRSQSMSFNALA